MNSELCLKLETFLEVILMAVENDAVHTRSDKQPENLKFITRKNSVAFDTELHM